MQIETLTDGFHANTYILIKGEEVLIIDPAVPTLEMASMVYDKKVIGILLTHAHFDHFLTLKELMLKSGAPCYLTKKAYAKLTDAEANGSMYFGYLKQFDFTGCEFKYLSDGKTEQIGSFSFKTIFTPGHTDCSVCFLFDEAIFTGDTLFQQGVGRTDLPTGSWFVLKQSLKQLMKLPGDLIVYPGHGDPTSIKEESLNNPYCK